jgi:CheY-like chemotaxis protein
VIGNKLDGSSVDEDWGRNSVDDQRATSSSHSGSEVSPPSTARTILLVDDDAEFRIALADALKLEGHHVIDVATGEAALAVLEAAGKTGSRPPDLLVLDLIMPSMSGIEVLQKLRAHPHWSRLSVLVVTGANDPMLPVRLDLPVAFKPDPQAVLEAVLQQLAANGARFPST